MKLGYRKADACEGDTLGSAVVPGWQTLSERKSWSRAWDPLQGS